MRWRDFHYDCSPIIDRKPLKWPQGARIAVLSTINLQCWDAVPPKSRISYPGGPQARPIPWRAGMPYLGNHTWRDYGHRVGISRMMEVFDRHRVRVSATINTSIGTRLPRLLEEMTKRHWEIVAHSRVENDLLVNFSGNRT